MNQSSILLPDAPLCTDAAARGSTPYGVDEPGEEDPRWWTMVHGGGPLAAVALHAGRHVRKGLLDKIALGEADRLREEDPLTDLWTAVAPNRVIAHRSRFEVDLNRPRDKAIYLDPADAWGLTLWKESPAEEEIEESLAYYDDFHEAVEHLLRRLERRCGRFLVYDLHTYNHRRDGVNGALADPAGNPEVNVGTGSVPNRRRWDPVIARFIQAVHEHDFDGRGRHLDVRENVRFQGGHFSQWVHEKFPDSGLVIAIEFKKFFMDEWSGTPDLEEVRHIGDALVSTLPAVLESLERVR